MSCLFAIYNLWPLPVDCVCVCYEHVGGWGCLAHGGASEWLLVGTWHRNKSRLFQMPESGGNSKSPFDTSLSTPSFSVEFTDLQSI